MDGLYPGPPGVCCIVVPVTNPSWWPESCERGGGGGPDSYSPGRGAERWKVSMINNSHNLKN